MECYSVTINADGSRLASGGLDGNIKIWDTDTLAQFQWLDQQDHKDDRLLPPESLRRPVCSMSRHNGVVTTVKFSPDGRFLASGSDDKIVLIWERDELMAKAPRFGEPDDLEHWTVRKRLVAHDNDIQDICWSPDGSLLVTVGLDRLIMIWSGTTFERIKRYDIHQSMVKGIVFDPANKFFATASDDRTVRIFRYSKKLHELVNNYEFQMEHVVFDPFKQSPLTSYFRRMSWSPDGQNIAVPNATNGPVPAVAIINRGSWSCDISLIGHEAPCEVCSFCPKLFRRDLGDSVPPEDGFYTVLATGGQDQSLAIWSTRQSKPLVVAQDIAQSAITDICWSPDGSWLYFSCLDGTVTCVGFDEQELGVAVSADLVSSQLHKFGRDHDANVFPESVDQLVLEEKALLLDGPREEPKVEPKVEVRVETKIEPLPAPTSTPSTPRKLSKASQVITTKNGKKRVAPMLVSTSSTNNMPQLPHNPIKKLKPNSKVSHSWYLLPRSGLTTAVHGTKERHLDQATLNGVLNNEDQDNDNEDMAMDLPNDGPSNSTSLSVSTLRKQKNKMKRQIMEARYPNQFKLISNLPEALFNHSSLVQHEMSQIINAHDFESIADIFSSTSATADTRDEDIIFAVLVAGIHHNKNQVYNTTESSPEQTSDQRSTIEVRNGPPWPEHEEDLDIEYNGRTDFQDPTSVIVTNNTETHNRKYVVYFPFKIQHALPIVIDATLYYYALVSFDGTLQIILAESGTLLCPSMELGQNLICLKQSNKYLMTVASNGLIYVWELPVFPKERYLKSRILAVSMSPIINYNWSLTLDKPTMSPNVKLIELDPSGCPIVMMSDTNDVYKYSADMMCWTKVIDSWYWQVADLDDKQKDYLHHVSKNGFKEDITRSKVGRYVFNHTTTELETVMKQRYNELMH